MNKIILSFGFIISAGHDIFGMDSFDFPDGGGDRDDFLKTRTPPAEAPVDDPQATPTVVFQAPKTYPRKADLPFSTLSNLLKRPHSSIFNGPPAPKVAKVAGLVLASATSARFGYPLVKVSAFRCGYPLVRVTAFSQPPKSVPTPPPPPKPSGEEIRDLE